MRMSSSTCRDGEAVAMESETMGRVTVAASIENLADLNFAREGRLPDEAVRRIEGLDALVDTGATLVSMPRRLIDQLGLKLLKEGRAKTTTGTATFRVFEPVRLTV